MPVRSRDAVTYVLALAIVAAMIVGALPMTPYEGDGIGIANGISDSAHELFRNVSMVAYNYDVQSGVNVVVKAVALVVGGEVWTVFSVLTVVAALLFVFFSVRSVTLLAGKDSHVPALVAFALFPEAIISAYYPNSVIFAAAFLAIGLYCYVAGRGSWILPAILLGCAVWMRLDVVIAFPAFLFLHRHGTPRRSFWHIAGALTAAGIIGLALLALSDVSLSRLFHSTGAHLEGSVEQTGGLPLGLGSKAFRTLIGFFPVATLVLVVLGAIRWMRDRDPGTVAAGLLPLVLMLMVQRANLTTPKYLVYSIPFLALMVVRALPRLNAEWVRAHRMLAVILILLSLQAVVGIRMIFRGKEYVERPSSLQRSSITLLPLWGKKLQSRALDSVTVVVGGGSKINTDDENRLTSGILFSPFCWREEKVMVEQNVATLRSAVNATGRDTLRVIASSFCNSGRQLMRWIMRKEGFTYGTAYAALGPGVECYVRGPQTVLLEQIIYERDVPSTFIGAIAALPPGEILFVSNIPWETSLVASLPENYPGLGDFGFRVGKREIVP
jgi:hypothetical protein